MSNPVQQLYDMIHAGLQLIIDSISNSVNKIYTHTVYGLVNILPDPNQDIDIAIDSVVYAFQATTFYISYADYVIHLPFLLICLGIIIGIELGLIPVKIVTFIGKAIEAIPFV